MTRQIPYLVEGLLDQRVALQLMKYLNIPVERGRSRYNLGGGLPAAVAKFSRDYPRVPLFVIQDLDQHLCSVQLRQSLNVPKSICYRIAVREVEAWLLADRASIIRFMQVSPSDYDSVIGPDPENIADPDNPARFLLPKEAVCLLAARSPSDPIRSEIKLVKGGSERAYTDTMLVFVQQRWNIPVAAANSRSLRCAIRRLEQLRDEGEMGIELCQ